MKTMWFFAAVIAAVAGCLSPSGDDDTRRLYEACDSSDECSAAADGCYLVHHGQASVGMCSQTCERDDDCPGGECAPLAGDTAGTRICYQRCENEPPPECGDLCDCYAEFACDTTDYGTGRVCLPAQ